MTYCGMSGCSFRSTSDFRCWILDVGLKILYRLLDVLFFCIEEDTFS